MTHILMFFNVTTTILPRQTSLCSPHKPRLKSDALCSGYRLDSQSEPSCCHHSSLPCPLQLRSLRDPEAIARNEDVLRIFLLACEPKQVKLSVLGLSCLQKLVAHNAVAPPALPQILTTLKEVRVPATCQLPVFPHPSGKKESVLRLEQLCSYSSPDPHPTVLMHFKGSDVYNANTFLHIRQLSS